MRKTIREIRRKASRMLMTDPKAKRHALVGPPKLWKMKQVFQLQYLTEQGLLPEHTLVDIGCGTLRGGSAFIKYLNENNYTGIDVRADALEQGRQELKEEGLLNKGHQLVHFEHFNDLKLDKQYDYLFAFSVLMHLSDDIANGCFDFVNRHIKPEGTFFANVNIGTSQEGHWIGFPVVTRERSFYEGLAKKHNLQMKEMGLLKDIGHVSNDPTQDNQVMFAFTR